MLSKVEQSLNKTLDKLKGTCGCTCSLATHATPQHNLTQPPLSPLPLNAEKVEEVRAQAAAAEHRPVVAGTYAAADSTQAAGPSGAQQPARAQQELPADSRAQSLHLCGFDVSGVSIAGQETCLIIPRCKLALDIGRCPQPSVFQQTVLITHGHLDHIGGVTFHAASRCVFCWVVGCMSACLSSTTPPTTKAQPP